jgi:hypothetical protein
VSVSRDVDVEVDPDTNAADITFVEVHRMPLRDLFRGGELRLWEDSSGWNGYALDDGDLYEVNRLHDADDWLRKEPVDAETVAQAIAQHVRDPAAGEAGEFVRGATPP